MTDEHEPPSSGQRTPISQTESEIPSGLIESETESVKNGNSYRSNKVLGLDLRKPPGTESSREQPESDKSSSENRRSRSILKTGNSVVSPRQIDLRPSYNPH